MCGIRHEGKSGETPRSLACLTGNTEAETIGDKNKLGQGGRGG